MTDTLCDAMHSLAALMEEETEILTRSPFTRELPEIANAKIRLTGRIESEVARLSREAGNWMEVLDAEARALLTEASLRLRDASAVNARVLSRQIELSVEMMAAINAEAKRLTGTRSQTYGARGGLQGIDAPAPISINAKL
ncbi:flagellar protein FlgN [Stakelama tenebrarum]|uniref:Flagellar protein FlgN n=1 Tax=Stakelama tenebrarum TaxID=2711215 RepID=A0A6G6Y4Q0_9SPHN|nr:flagellar protein FlgN [Sphingosinithalassobacter tenebrarum]QIG79698.1 flagellar protein FlgN [Sphingosinithalassobacter tenebrarum]